MKIADLNFLDDIVEKAESLVGGASAEDFGSLFQELKSLTGDTVGLLNAAFNVVATGTNEATTDIKVDSSGDVKGKVSFAYSTITNAFASTPGS
jgi:hypothetical protein